MANDLRGLPKAPPPFGRRENTRMRELEAELADLRNRRHSAIEGVSNALQSVFPMVTVTPAMVENAIERAETLRDALEPFDSGERHAADPQQ